MSTQTLNASPILVDWRGTKYRIGLFKQRAQGDVVAAIEHAVRAKHFKMRDVTPPDIWREEYEAIKNTDFSVMSPAFTKFFSTWEGQLAVLAVLLTHGGNPMSTDDIQDMMLDEHLQVAEALSRVVEQSFPPKVLARVESREPSQQSTQP